MDQQPTPPPYTPPPVDNVTGPGSLPPRPGGKRPLGMLALFAVALVLLGAVGYMFLHKSSPKTAGNAPATTQSPAQSPGTTRPSPATNPCDSGFTNYQNGSLGIGFCYPASWGTPTAVNAKFDPADSGSRWRVSFSKKAAVNLGVVSDDWATSKPRDASCDDPAVQSLPPFSPFSTTWQTEGTPTATATRGIEEQTDKYLIEERVDDIVTSGVCLEGYTVIQSGIYYSTAETYTAPFDGTVKTPDQHLAAPNALISAKDRTEFAVFVKSVHKV